MDQYIGKLLDNRYEILELIGSGGMARVYKARCHRLNRLVAIKILREDLAQDAEFRRRFHDESQAVAMLSHPNIVAVYDVSRSSQLEYIVMELIDGITLKQYMQKKGNKLNWREALHFITQITKALGHAHSRGIIHRDIKPHNVMVLRDGSVKVADFGIARVASGGHSTLTQEALGSVHYISPEQARGSFIDARSDLYSAGVVLYEMITGRLPFEGDTPVSVAIQHINSIPLSPREIDPSIPEALEAITMKAMAPNPDNRYLNADEMLADLEEFRKNPTINFEYNLNEFSVASPEEEDRDKTQIHAVSASHRSREARPERRHSGGHREDHRPRRQEEDEDGPQGGFPWPVVGAVVAILAFIGVVVYFLYNTFLSGLFTPQISYDVPNLIGKSYEEVMTDPSILGEHFTVVLGETKTDEDTDAGVILHQDPAADSKVQDEVTPITVTVSGGPETVNMLDLKNMEYSKAYLAVTEMGLKVATPTFEHDDTIAYNHVISFTPLENNPVPLGTEVHMVVSLGPATETFSMPSLVGLTQEKAEEDITALGLKVGTVTPVYSDTAQAGQVVWQYPEAYKEVEAGSVVSLQVSQGPDPSTQAKDVTKTLSVPLPETGGVAFIQILADGEVVFSDDIDTTMEMLVEVSVTAKAGESKNMSLYVDGVLQNSWTESFEG